MASVVIKSPAIDAAFCRAARTTLVGSMIPLLTRFTYSPFWASKPKAVLPCDILNETNCGFRFDPPWRNPDHADALRADLFRQALAVGRERSLCGRVCERRFGQRQLPLDRGHMNNHADRLRRSPKGLDEFTRWHSDRAPGNTPRSGRPHRLSRFTACSFRQRRRICHRRWHRPDCLKPVAISVCGPFQTFATLQYYV